MIKIENVVLASPEQMDFIIQGMRNPMNSYANSDSAYCHKDLIRDCNTCIHSNTDYPACKVGGFDIGSKDYGLMKRLSNAGTEHRKYMRMIPAYMRITAPLYW